MDPDVGDTHTYTIQNARDYPFLIIGDHLIAHTVVDYEDQNAYVLNITATDSKGLSFTKVKWCKNHTITGFCWAQADFGLGRNLYFVIRLNNSDLNTDWTIS